MNLTNDQKQWIAVISEAVIALLALYNLAAPQFNLPHLTIANETITSLVTAIVVIGIAGWNAWKNRNFTGAAKLAQLVLDAIKSGVLAPEAVTEMLEEAQEDFDYQTQVDQEKLNAEIEQEVTEFMEKQDEIED